MKKSIQATVTTSVLLLASLTSFATTNEESGTETTRQLVVLVYNYAQVPGKVLAKAKQEADRVFEKAGFEIDWRDCAPGLAEPEAQCAGLTHSIPIRLRIIRRTKAQQKMMGTKSTGVAIHPGGAGVGTLATVFYGRVEHIAKDGSYPVSLILGMVAAHEIGHLLLPTGEHHPHGIMRAGFSAKDWRRARQNNLSFTKKQSASIRKGLRARTIG